MGWGTGTALSLLGWLVEVDGWCGHGQPWRIPCPLGCPGGVTAVTQEKDGWNEVPGTTHTQLPHAWASWQWLQHAQSVPEGARSFPRQRKLGCALIPRVRDCSQPSRMALGQKALFSFPTKLPRCQCRASVQQCDCLGRATPLLIPTGPAAAFSL